MIKLQLPLIISFNFNHTDDVTDNIELGNTKAGLASMETLDDSTKDPWNIENGETKDEQEAKNDEEKKALDSEDQEKPLSIWQQIRNYNCSIGRHAI